jgi:iron complex transport system substrate-binding protein
MPRIDEIEALARVVVNAGFELHRDIGPGLLESAYEALMASILVNEGCHVQRQVPIQMNYRGVVVDNAFKIDLLVNNCLVIELKSIERLTAVHGKQVLTYLRLMHLPLGLLMNFGEATFKSGLRRIANNYYGTIG